MSLFVLTIFLCCVVPSYQQLTDVKITKNMIPSELREGETVVLRCVVRNSESYRIVAWFKDEELVTNGSDVARNNSVYFIKQSYPEPGKLNYELNITAVSRMDYGRWTCRATANDGSPVSENVVVNVLYVPDDMYPVCQVDLVEASLTCKTQEGNPRVQVAWSVEPSGRARIRARQSTSQGIIYSKVSLGGIGAPTVDNERMVCQSSGRLCSISKEYIYNMTSLSLLVVETENDVRFYCNVSDNLLQAELTIYNDNVDVNGTQLSQDENVKILSFQNVKEIEGMNVKCKLQWGVLAYKIEEKQLDMQASTQRSVTYGDGKSKQDNSDDADKSNMPNESGEGSSISHHSKVWLVWLFLGIVLLFVIVVVIVYLYRKKKDNPV